MPIKSVKSMVEEANRSIEAVSPQAAQALAANEGALIVDIRDVRELQREGKVPGAFHCPRGMLEFWIDPESPYHKPAFAENRTFIFYCASAWRSALATKTAKDMGLEQVKHIDGGFSAWKAAGLPVEAVERK
ncbi:MAG: rhodanese-like domain-containing protein [Pararhizobium sp.]